MSDFGSFGGYSRQGGDYGEAVFKVADSIATKMSAQDIAIADHEGQLKSISGLIAAIQSSLSAWQNVAIGVGAAMVAAVAILATFQVLSFSAIDGLRSESRAQVSDTNGRIDKLDGRMQGIETAQRILPSQISQQLLNTSALLVTIHNDRPTTKSPSRGAANNR